MVVIIRTERMWEHTKFSIRMIRVCLVKSSGSEVLVHVILMKIAVMYVMEQRLVVLEILKVDLSILQNY